MRPSSSLGQICCFKIDRRLDSRPSWPNLHVRVLLIFMRPARTGGCCFAGRSPRCASHFQPGVLVSLSADARPPRRRSEATQALSPRRLTRLARAAPRAPQTPKLLLHLAPWPSPRGASRASPRDAARSTNKTAPASTPLLLAEPKKEEPVEKTSWGGLADQDRIFTNLYGEQDWRLVDARKRGDWHRTKRHPVDGPGLDRPGDER